MSACHLCRGKGKVFEMEGWAAPSWMECSYCRGTGRAPIDHPCGCQSVNGLITSCYGGHGHVSGEPANISIRRVAEGEEPTSATADTGDPHA